MPPSDRFAILQIWGKTDKSEHHGRQEHEFHPLAYHLLDVAACADAILDANPARLGFLADLCEIEPEKLRRTLVCLIALHDLGKCARGFQGKVPELWPSALGPRPEPQKFISVRHDAAGLWLFKNEPRLTALGEQLILQLLPSDREKIFQSVVGHHGEPLELDFRGGVAAIVNSEVQIGQAAQLAATQLAEAIYAVFDPPGISPPEVSVPTLSFALAGLAVLADWLGSNCNWFEFATPRGSERLFDELMRYWRDVAGPVAKRAVRQAGLIPAQSAPFRGVKSLFPHVDKPTPLQLFCEEVALPDGPILFVIEDMTGAGKTEAAVTLAHRLLANGRARGVHVALPTMATANAMFGRLSASYRRLFASGTDPSVVLVHGRRDLCEGFRSLPRELAYDDHCDEKSDDPSEITASAYCADWIARSNKQAFLAQMGAGTIDQALLAILPARHQALRLWGLADKVLVIDEAHAYDAYMYKELETLLCFHAAPRGGQARCKRLVEGTAIFQSGEIVGAGGEFQQLHHVCGLFVGLLALGDVAQDFAETAQDSVVATAARSAWPWSTSTGSRISMMSSATSPAMSTSKEQPKSGATACALRIASPATAAKSLSSFSATPSLLARSRAWIGCALRTRRR